MNAVTDIKGHKANPVQAFPLLADGTVMLTQDLAVGHSSPDLSGFSDESSMGGFTDIQNVKTATLERTTEQRKVALNAIITKQRNRAHSRHISAIQDLDELIKKAEERATDSIEGDIDESSDSTSEIEVSEELENLKELRNKMRGDFACEPDTQPASVAVADTLQMHDSQPSEKLVAPPPQATSIQGAPDAAPAPTTTMSATVGNAAIDPCAVFREMESIAASELSIAFVGDKSESGLGPNNMMEISVRKTKKRVPLGSLDLIDKRNGTLNSQGAILLGMAGKRRFPNNPANNKRVQRLRRALCDNLGIQGDPFEPFVKGTRWTPLFELADNRGAADKRAKDKAEYKQLSVEQMSAMGRHIAAPELPQDSIDRGERAIQRRQDFPADDWMQKNGYSYESDDLNHDN